MQTRLCNMRSRKGCRCFCRHRQVIYRAPPYAISAALYTVQTRLMSSQQQQVPCLILSYWCCVYMIVIRLSVRCMILIIT